MKKENLSLLEEIERQKTKQKQATKQNKHSFGFNSNGSITAVRTPQSFVGHLILAFRTIYQRHLTSLLFIVTYLH
jgi:hypothetical protein